MPNNIKKFREERGWSMRVLAARVNSTSSTINKLEKSQIQLDVNWLTRLSRVLEVPMMALIDQDAEVIPPQNDVEAFPGDAKATFPELNVGDDYSVYVVKTDALDQIGIIPGYLLLVSHLTAQFDKVQTGNIVIVTPQESDDTFENISLLRQFIAPNLLITNSGTRDQQTVINMKSQPMDLVGVVLYHFSNHR